MKHEKITEDQLEARVARHIAASTSEGYTLLHQQWAAGIAAYTGVPTGNLAKNTNMSKIILNVVRHATDTVHTHLLEIFGDDKETVVFNPSAHQQVPVEMMVQGQMQQVPVSTARMGEQTTALINHILHKKNNGFDVISTWLFDALIYGTGFVYTYVDERKTSRKQSYRDISPMQFNAILQDLESKGWECEIIEEKVVSSEIIENAEGIVAYDQDYTGSMYEIMCSKRTNHIAYENVPPEEMMFNEGIETMDMDHPRTQFIGRRKMMSRSDIKDLSVMLGVEIDDETLGAPGSALQWEYVKESRNLYNGEWSNTWGNTEPNEGENQLFEVSQNWVKADMDGDGIAEWIMTYNIGDNMVYWEEWTTNVPISSFSPWPVKHTIWGLSTYVKLFSLHSAKSGVARQLLDLGTLQNTPRFFGNPDEINDRNFQIVKPGLVPVKKTFTKDSVVPIPTPTGSPHSMVFLEYLDKEVINEVGIDVTNGLVNQTIQESGNDEAKTKLVLDNASAKIDRIAREFAETGLRNLVWDTYCITIEHSDEEWMQEMVNTLTPNVPYIAAQIDTADYMLKDDLVATVGLGHETKQDKLQNLASIAKMQDALMGHPTAPIMIPEDKRMAVVEAMVKVLDRDVADFFPTMQEIGQSKQQMQMQQQQMMQMKIQTELERHQAEVGKTHAEIGKIQSETVENEMQTTTGYEEQERKNFATQVDAEATAFQLEQAQEGNVPSSGVNVKIGS